MLKSPNEGVTFLLQRLERVRQDRRQTRATAARLTKELERTRAMEQFDTNVEADVIACLLLLGIEIPPETLTEEEIEDGEISL